MYSKLRNHDILLIISMIILFSCAVCFHEAVGQSVIKAGERCITVILPSLYFFSVLTAFSVRSGFLERIAEPFQRICKGKAVLWAVVIFSQIGGYPVGAQFLHGMYQEGRISAEQEQKLVCVCMGCGFGFLFATVGGNIRSALLIWLMMSIPNLLLAFLLIRNMSFAEHRQIMQKKTFSVLVTESVESAASAMLKICGMILAFGAVMGILEGIFGKTEDILNSILEISNLSDYLYNGGNLPIATGLLSFGGICVHLQIAAVCENHIAWGKFWLCRIMTAVLSGIICMVSMKYLVPESIPAFLTETKLSVQSSQSAVPVCCLLIMSVFVVKKYDFLEKTLTKSKK